MSMFCTCFESDKPKDPMGRFCYLMPISVIFYSIYFLLIIGSFSLAKTFNKLLAPVAKMKELLSSCFKIQDCLLHYFFTSLLDFSFSSKQLFGLLFKPDV